MPMLCYCSDAKTSERFYLSCETVKTLIRSVLRKLGLNRRELFRNCNGRSGDGRLADRAQPPRHRDQESLWKTHPY